MKSVASESCAPSSCQCCSSCPSSQRPQKTCNGLDMAWQPNRHTAASSFKLRLGLVMTRAIKILSTSILNHFSYFLIVDNSPMHHRASSFLACQNLRLEKDNAGSLMRTTCKSAEKHTHQLTRVCGKEPLLAINHHTAKALPEQHFESSSEERKPLCIIASFSGKFGKTKTKPLTFNAAQWQSATLANDCHDACGLPIVGRLWSQAKVLHDFTAAGFLLLRTMYKQVQVYIYIYVLNIRINLNLYIYIYVCVCKYTYMYLYQQKFQYRKL